MPALADTIEQLARDVARTADPETALHALRALRQELDQTEPDLVARALQGGASWRQIARALGISKQAAHRKHRHLAGQDTISQSAAGPMILVTSEAAAASGSLAKKRPASASRRSGPSTSSPAPGAASAATRSGRSTRSA